MSLALLLTVAADPPVGADVGPDTVIAGVPLARRIALTAARAGIPDVRAPGVSPASLEGEPPAGACRVIVLPGNVLPQAGWLRGLCDMALVPETLWVDSAGTVVVETTRAALVLSAARAQAGPADLLAKLRGAFDKVDGELDPRGRFVLESAADLPAARRWLFQGLLKDSEGFMSRHFERRVSLAVTRRLVDTHVSPNTMTLVSLGIGLASAPFFVSWSPTLQLTGAFLFLLHSILDGCDGELARLKFLESRLGAVLDFWGDNVVHVAVFACMALGWSRHVGSSGPLVLGAMACASTVLAATTVAPHIVTTAATGGARSIGARVADALAHRDFIYIIIVLAAFGRAAWFVASVAIGTPLFVLVRVWADRTRPRRA